jgi:membrane protease YdiL (CAAX protease family)
MDGN